MHFRRQQVNSQLSVCSWTKNLYSCLLVDQKQTNRATLLTPCRESKVQSSSRLCTNSLEEKQAGECFRTTTTRGGKAWLQDQILHPWSGAQENSNNRIPVMTEPTILVDWRRCIGLWLSQFYNTLLCEWRNGTLPRVFVSATAKLKVKEWAQLLCVEENNLPIQNSIS